MPAVTCKTIGDTLKTIPSIQQCCHCNPELLVSSKRGCRESRFYSGCRGYWDGIVGMRRRPKLDRTIPQRYPKCSPEWPRKPCGRSCVVSALLLGPEARTPQISRLQASSNSRNPRSLKPEPYTDSPHHSKLRMLSEASSSCLQDAAQSKCNTVKRLQRPQPKATPWNAACSILYCISPTLKQCIVCSSMLERANIVNRQGTP